MSFVTTESNSALFNGTFELRHSDVYPPRTMAWLTAFLVTSAAGIPGNLITIIIIVNSKKLRCKPINMILAHQSFVDIMVCIVTIVEEIAGNYVVNPAIPFFCHYILTKTTKTVCCFTSTYNITVLSVERYLAIIDPLNYDTDKVKRRLPYVFIGEWLLCGIAFMIVPYHTITRNGKCLMGHHMIGTVIWDLYSPYEFSLAFAIPLIISLYCYGRMLICLHQSARGSSGASKDSKSTNVDKLRLAQLNIFKTCLTVIFFFIICWSLAEISVFFYLVGVYKTLATQQYVIGHLLIVLNSVVNPYIYAIRYDEFKDQLKSYLKIGKK